MCAYFRLFEVKLMALSSCYYEEVTHKCHTKQNNKRQNAQEEKTAKQNTKKTF